MSGKSTPFRQDRRQWLKMSASTLGASLLPSMAAEEHVQSSPHQKPDAAQRRNQAITHFFTPKQYALVEELTETIIPSDSRSGGAKAARVAEYIEQVVNQSVEEERKTLWKEGLKLINLMSQHSFGKSFVDSSASEKIAVLTILSDNDEMIDLPEIRFFRDLKSMTVQGYYTSQIGIHDELKYKGNTALLEYVGCDDSEKT
jgi:hypothetical protein